MKPVDFGGCTFAWLETKYGRLLSINPQSHHEQYEALAYQPYIPLLLESGEYDLFVDCGSFIGLYAFVGSYNCNHVIAYEASPFIYGITLFNLRHKFNVDCVYAWVGNKEQIPKAKKEAYGMVTGGRDFKYNIPIIELDEAILPLIDPAKQILIKIDIEGNELEALKRCSELIKLPNVHWVIDCHPQYDQLKITPQKVIDLFRNRIIYVARDVVVIMGRSFGPSDSIFNYKAWEVIRV